MEDIVSILFVFSCPPSFWAGLRNTGCVIRQRENQKKRRNKESCGTEKRRLFRRFFCVP